MTTRPFSRHLRRFALDALAGVGLFLLIAAATAGNTSFAAATLLNEVGAAATRVADASVSSPGLVTLAVTFSVLFALNAAFFRHLNRRYKPARKDRKTADSVEWSGRVDRS